MNAGIDSAKLRTFIVKDQFHQYCIINNLRKDDMALAADSTVLHVVLTHTLAVTLFPESVCAVMATLDHCVIDPVHKEPMAKTVFSPVGQFHKKYHTYCIINYLHLYWPYKRKRADSHHPAHTQGLIQVLALHSYNYYVVSNNSVSGQYRP